jgi:hypothetical protein
MHIVNWNSDKYKSLKEALKHSDGLAVLGVLFEVSAKDNPVLDPMIQAIQQVRDPGKINLSGYCQKYRYYLDGAPVLVKYSKLNFRQNVAMT